MSTALGLHQLKNGQKARIRKIHDRGENVYQRILEMGFLEGAEVEFLRRAPFGGDPIAVRVRGCIMGLRNNEASSIEVEVL